MNKLTIALDVENGTYLYNVQANYISPGLLEKCRLKNLHQYKALKVVLFSGCCNALSIDG